MKMVRFLYDLGVGLTEANPKVAFNLQIGLVVALVLAWMIF